MRDPEGTPATAPWASSLGKTERDTLAKLFRQGGTFCARIPPTPALAWLAIAIHREFKRPVVWVADGPRSLDVFFQDLVTLTQVSGVSFQVSPAFFPAWESLPGHGAPPHADLVGDRLRTLQRCLDPDPPAIIATCVQALMQRTLSPDLLRAHSFTFRKGAYIELAEITAMLELSGYTFYPEVQAKGHAAVRGGILDLWPPGAAWPFRVELFGPTIESIRTFDPASQTSTGEIDSASLSPSGEPTDQLKGSLLDFLPAGAAWAWIDADSIAHHAEMYGDIIRTAKADHVTQPLEVIRSHISDLTSQISFTLTGTPASLNLDPVESLPVLSGQMLQPDVIEKSRTEFLERLTARAREGWATHVFFSTPGSRDRFAESHPAAAKLFTIHTGALSEGFTYPPAKLTVLAESDFYGRRKEIRGRYDPHGQKSEERAKPSKAPGILGERIAEWTDIQPGDLVVHVDHGIGKYLGLFEIEFNGQQQEVLAIEYAEKAKLYLPVAQTHLLSRYVGVGKRRPDLHTLGGKRWEKEKVAAEKSVQDLASLLIETQAQRDALAGHAFPPDTPWQHEFEASFPFKETPDQERAIIETKRDMESTRPMDRLVCGDVGYGKTEVAMRAAFKAVMDGKQVGMLVPTTILAQQHYDTFCERMAAYPVRIAMLSRFQTASEQAKIIGKLGEGSLDIVIGTHRLIQKDVAFKDLGLVIIDEEQRFGVKNKEHLKHLRKLVDVLTLTATPIPRTLYMSLTGAKDLSTIQTAPVERLPIETIVVQNSDEIVRKAILDELNREGQIYYLHNRVRSIYQVKERLQKLVPEARIEVGHGQMNEDELSAIMHAFVRGDFDVLLCTTIIESGLDIPNVNTILIDRADRFGMAELYQLRGRVGRYKRRAYAYLLLPRHGQLFDMARKRIGAIKRYSHLGAGFKLALRDLEIRGAGNILGAAQSGHIAAVGFDLYCQLLKRTVAQLKGETAPPIIDVEVKLDFIDLSPGASDGPNAAVIPVSYVEDENLRIGLYRLIAGASSGKELESVLAGMRDRFGKIPPAADRLVSIARLRIAAAGKRIRRIEVNGDKVMMTQRKDFITTDGKFPRLKSRSAADKLAELLAIVKKS